MSRSGMHILASLLLATNSIAPVLAADPSQLNFKIFSPSASEPAKTTDSSSEATGSQDSMWSENAADKAKAADTSADKPASTSTDSSVSTTTTTTTSTETTTAGTETPSTDSSADSSTKPATETGDSTSSTGEGKVLQGYIRVVPSGTKIPIIMDSAVDSDTSQEGDEFAARTGEDLMIDGSTLVPAGSVIKGRIAQLNAPKHVSRSGSVALKFDTITTPDNRQIPLVANLVARGGVVHAKRGLKDIAMTTGTVMLPTLVGVGIGAVAGGASNSSSSIGTGGGALVGAAVGVAIGVIILCAKKGKKVDVRPGDELKIELAEDLRMPM